MANNIEFLKKDITYILQLNKQIQYHNKNDVERAHNLVLEKKLFKTALGQKYVTRLEQIIDETEFSYACVLCGKDLDNSTLVCNRCMGKYKLMTPVQDAEAREAAAEISEATDEARELAEAREIMTARNAKEAKRIAASLDAAAAKTTPLEYSQEDVQPRSWLFLRIFVALMLTFGFLYICAVQLHNFNTIFGLLFFGAALFPFSILTLMYENNTPKNISFFDVLKMLFSGSIAALLLTTITFEIFPIGQLSYSGAVIVGFIEELIKLLVIIIFIRLIDPKYILNGLLIGAAVGAGFSVFESAGYAFRFYLLNGSNIGYLTDIILLRAWSSLGSHTVWSAIIGGGLLSAKTDKPFSFKLFYNPEFLSDFTATLILHFIWNSPFMNSGSNVYIKLIVMTVLAWIIILSLLKSGVRQFKSACFEMHVNLKGDDACPK